MVHVLVRVVQLCTIRVLMTMPNAQMERARVNRALPGMALYVVK